MGGPLSLTEFQCGQQQARGVLQGWCLVRPTRHQSKEPAYSMDSRWPLHAAWTDGALQPACLVTVGGCQVPAAGGTRVYTRERGLQAF